MTRTPKVVYDSWEATLFDVTRRGRLALADVAAGLGVETFVVDDGWFTGRVDDHGGLGGWTPDPAKFRSGVRVCGEAGPDEVEAGGFEVLCGLAGERVPAEQRGHAVDVG
jgi:alpha-galactosidase